ncbi:MAG: aminopeptidase P N-terminal domain-containing protein [Myxococcota bacterium]
MNLYAERRSRLLSALGPDAVALIPTYTEQLRNADTHFRFRTDSDFYYLTGFAEPDALLVLSTHRADAPMTLFLRPKDPARETWTGRRLGLEGAREQLGAQETYSIHELEKVLPSLLEGARTLYHRPGAQPELDRKVFAAFHALRSAKRRMTPSPTHIVDLTLPLHTLRLYKSPEELEIMHEAARVTAEAHCLAMSFTRPGRFEYELEALVEFHFRRNGANGPAYPSIVGGGANACILHYIDNSERLQDGELILLDAGAELGFYAADITRTWPINGRFTPAQRDVYAVVLEAQRRAIETLRVGVPFQRYHEVAVEVLTEGLVSLGILSGSVEQLIEESAYTPYYMHRTGHFLGLDVHDAGEYVQAGQSRPLESGMVLTVEPGLYLADHIPGLPAAFHNIGVRIEDDILITPHGPEILTHGVPKDIDSIEALVGSQA